MKRRRLKCLGREANEIQNSSPLKPNTERDQIKSGKVGWSSSGASGGAVAAVIFCCGNFAKQGLCKKRLKTDEQNGVEY